MNGTMTALERQTYKALKEKYDQLGKGAVRLTQSALILMQVVNPAVAQYTFPVLKTENPVPLADEIRLAITDEFVITRAGVYIVGDVSSALLPTLASVTWFTTPPIELAAATVVWWNLYRGNMAILVNNINFLDNWDLKRHEKRNQTQFQNFSAGIPTATWQQNDFEDDAMYGMAPTVTFSGAKKNTVQINLPAAVIATTVPFVTPNGTLNIAQNKIAIVYRGFLAQNASAFQK